METLKLTYNNISQMNYYFKSLENIPNLVFKERRALSKLNLELDKEYNFLNDELNKIIEKYSEKDEDGKPVVLENGYIKLQSETTSEVDKIINDIYSTEIEIEYIPFKLNEEYFENFQCDKITFKLIEENFIK